MTLPSNDPIRGWDLFLAKMDDYDEGEIGGERFLNARKFETVVVAVSDSSRQKPVLQGVKRVSVRG